jgi:pentapeptide MXKDX repeat protein
LKYRKLKIQICQLWSVVNFFLIKLSICFEISGEEMSGEEMSGKEMSGEEMSGEGMSGEEMSGEEMSREEMSGEEMTGEEMAREELTIYQIKLIISFHHKTNTSSTYRK